ncbi:hypothetical protein ACFLSI_06585, partial [Bacteroidota bacterium]
MNGKLHQKKISEVYPIKRYGVIAESIFLFLIGTLPIIIHAKFRYDLGIPGHHGLEYMALIMLGRTATDIRWASVFISLGILSMLFLPYIGLKNPITAIVFVLPPFIVDIIYNSKKNWKNNILLLSVIGGIAYSILPVSKLLIMLTTGFPYKAFLRNPVVPFITHFI